jgi:hypothetical protein
MTRWEPAGSLAPRTSSRWPAPGIFVNVEFGVSMAPNERTHTASMKYTSKRMEERLHEERIRQQYEQGLYHSQLPSILLPANSTHQEQQARQVHQHTAHRQQQERQRRLGVRHTEQHERATSAPPTVADRTQPISPISPVSPIGSLQHTSSLPIERMNQALPPSPSQFRLGEADLPWSMPPWYRPPESEFTDSITVRSEPEPLHQATPQHWEPSPLQTPEIRQPSRRREEPTPLLSPLETPRRPISSRRLEIPRSLDDPLRVRDLEDLHQAMMTVDSLGNDGWEPWTSDSARDMPRGPRSIGWAIRSEEAPSRAPVSGPPPYVVSQWEDYYGFSPDRPKTSGT